MALRVYALLRVASALLLGETHCYPAAVRALLTGTALQAAGSAQHTHVDVYVCAPRRIHYQLVVCLSCQVPLCTPTPAQAPGWHDAKTTMAVHAMHCCMSNSMAGSKAVCRGNLRVRQPHWVCCMPGPGHLPGMFQTLLLQDSRSSPRNNIPISRHVMTVITPADYLARTVSNGVGQPAQQIASCRTARRTARHGLLEEVFIDLREGI